MALPLTQQKKFHRYIKLKVSRVYYQSFIPFWTITLGTFPRTSPVPNLSSSGENLPEKSVPKNCRNRSEDPEFGGWRIGMQVPYLSCFFFAPKNTGDPHQMSESYPVFAIHTPVTARQGVRWILGILESDMRVANYNDQPAP